MNVIVMVSEGYPLKFSANNSKGEFIALGMQYAGCEVLMMDSMHGTKGENMLQKGMSGKGVKYVTLPRRGKKRAFLYNIPCVWCALKENKVKGEKNHLLMGMMDYPLFVIVAVMAMLQGYSRSALFHEWHIGCTHSNFLWKWEAYIKDYTFGYYLNAIFPIGHYLQKKAKKFNKPLLLVPVLASYDRIIDMSLPKDHFTFCGHALYLLRNSIVLDAFGKVVKVMHNARLELILVGNEHHLNQIREVLLSKGISDNVSLKSQLPQDELYHIYDTSVGLLIPLDPNNLQDKARFSQKIAEYVASKRPIITSEAGEIPYYFKHEESAIIVPFDADGYAEGMLSLLKNPEMANEVGLKGFEVGDTYFNYKKVGARMVEFIECMK